MAGYAARRIRNNIMMGLSILASVVGLFFLFVILATLLYKGLTAITPQMFTESTPPPGEDGGLINAIFGSVVMTVVAIAVATPVGILAGTYLAEYSRGHWLGEAAKFVNDILLSAPSIIIGLFVYTVLVVPFGHFSAWSGAAALGLIALPVINRTTQDMLGLVPGALREAAAALGTLVEQRHLRRGIGRDVLLLGEIARQPRDLRVLVAGAGAKRRDLALQLVALVGGGGERRLQRREVALQVRIVAALQLQHLGELRDLRIELAHRRVLALDLLAQEELREHEQRQQEDDA